MHCSTLGPGSRKKKIRRVEWSIVRRIISLLYYDGDMKKTNISMKAGLGYDKCVLYLDWMEMLDLIVREVDDQGFQRIKLSQRGKSLYEMYFREIGLAS